MMDQGAPYTGTDNLEVMAEAINYNRYLVELIRDLVNPSAPVLDVGAGIGTFALSLQQQGLDVRAFEPDPRQASSIRQNGIECHESLAEFAPGSMGSLYSLNVLEHIQDDQAALVDWGRLLPAGGLLVLYVPAFQVLFSDMDEKVGHFRRYTRSQLTALLHVAGFDISQSRYVDSIGFLVTLLYRMIAKPGGDIDRRALRIYDRLLFPISLFLDRFVSSYVGKNVLVVARKR